MDLKDAVSQSLMECRFKLRSLVPENHTSCDGCCRLQVNIDHLGDCYVHPKHGTQAFLHSTTTGMWALHVLLSSRML